MDPLDQKWLDVVLNEIKNNYAELKEQRTKSHNEFRERLTVIEQQIALIKQKMQAEDLNNRLKELESSLSTIKVGSKLGLDLMSASLAFGTGIIGSIVTHLIISKLSQ